MSATFARSAVGSLGVEYESTIVDSASGRPLPLATSLTKASGPLLQRGVVGPDLFEPVLEYSTGVCRAIGEARDDLQGFYSAVAPVLQSHDAALLGMGLHPTAGPDDFLPVTSQRYSAILEHISWPARRLTTNALHVHIGMMSGQAAIDAARRIRPVLPILLGLSASSPLHLGEVTGLASTRTSLWASVPVSGQMPDFDTFSDYCGYRSQLCSVAATPELAEPRWECRPSPTLGTLEIRVCDSVAALDDVMALVALAWCLGVGGDALSDLRIADVLIAENRWRTIRYGTRCDLLVASDSAVSFAAAAEHLIDVLLPTARALGCRPELERCRRLAWGEAPHQRLTSVSGSPSSVELARDAIATMRVDW